MGKGAPFSLGVTWRQNQEVSRCSQGHGLLIHADSCIKRIQNARPPEDGTKTAVLPAGAPRRGVGDVLFCRKDKPHWQRPS